MGKKILESSEVKFMNLPPYVFDVDHVAKIRSGLSNTIFSRKTQQNYHWKTKWPKVSEFSDIFSSWTQNLMLLFLNLVLDEAAWSGRVYARSGDYKQVRRRISSVKRLSCWWHGVSFMFENLLGARCYSLWSHILRKLPRAYTWPWPKAWFEILTLVKF